MPIQLNDDHIQSFLVRLVDYLERHPATFSEEGWRVSDEGYDHLREFVFNQLEPYSNGYMNMN